jgi:spermidine/putrescine transport system substrate-binding protein
MKKVISLITALFLALIPLSVGKISVSAESDLLKIYNWEDYIYEDEDSGVTLIDDFKIWYQNTYHNSVDVEYSTFGTNEIMYNELKINKNGDSYNYDLVCPSDYMIQKMIAEEMLEPIGTIQNYESNASGFLKDLFSTNGWDTYSIGYMWGTMGYVYNPEYVAASDISSWSAIWNIDYKNKSTLKDSVRDTYFLGVAYVYRDELNALADELDKSINTVEYQNAKVEYQNALAEIFNRTDDATIAKVEKALTNVKDNIFSFELDDGKNDMATGKVNINFCWSGDGVYAMDQAEVDNVELYYSVPKEGSNIWFDGWVMPKGANKEVAQRFLEFISLPSTAIDNMEYIGYTSAIAGDNVYDWIADTYSADENAETTYNVDLNYFFDNITGERTGIITTDTIGRQFSAQYPDEDTILRCSIMQNFDDETLEKVNTMWERVKGNTLDTWLILVIIAAVILIAGGFLTIVILKKKNIIGKSKKKLTVVKRG